MSRPGAVSAAPATKAARQGKIIAILASTPVRSQDELVDRLAADGVAVTQATLSRDLDEIGAVRLRGPDGVLVYALPPDHPESAPSAPAAITAAGVDARAAGPLSGLSASVLAALAKVASDLLLTAEASGNLVVLKTPPGAAQLMASVIDRAGAAAVLGTVAGDDTVLVVARDPLGGDDLAATFLRLAERRAKPDRQSLARGHAAAREQT
ncbi:MAG TPA: arginine repressor [Streptosporangiaceae bacterium]|nr:arginine repressor [Streptosporangiaceae bacterium]